MLFRSWTVALNNVVVSEWTQDLAPESALDKTFFLCDFIDFPLDQLASTLAKRNTCNLKFLCLFDKVPDNTIDFLLGLLYFTSKLKPGPILGHFGIVVCFCLLDDIGQFNQIKIIEVIILDKTEHIGQMRNNFGIIKDGLGLDCLLNVSGWKGKRKDHLFIVWFVSYIFKW